MVSKWTASGLIGFLLARRWPFTIPCITKSFDSQRKLHAASLELRKSTAQSNDPFSFFAPLPARRLGCWEVPCRLKKLDLLARYTALYANEVHYPASP